MAGRMLLPVCLLAAFAKLAAHVCLAFVGGSLRAPASTSLRTSTARRALPVGAEPLADASSLTTSLLVSAPAWAANTLGLLIPIGFCVILYLQSERSKAEEGRAGLP